ncbi:hypothetical protein FKM82_001636 [Ascaphus truei]
MRNNSIIATQWITELMCFAPILPVRHLHAIWEQSIGGNTALYGLNKQHDIMGHVYNGLNYSVLRWCDPLHVATFLHLAPEYIATRENSCITPMHKYLSLDTVQSPLI